MRNLKDFKIVEKRKIWYLISIVVALIGSIFMLAYSGLNLGIDFTGGTTIEIDGGSIFETQKAFRGEVSEFVQDYFKEKDLNVKTVQYSSTSSGGLIEFKFQQELGSEIQSELETLLNDKAEFEKEGIQYRVSTHTFSKTASGQLIVTTFLAVGIALALILVYIIFRFSLSSGLASIIALVHDVIILIAITAIFKIQVNASFLAAVLTVIGYSLNASVIIFDKVRSYNKSAGYEDAPRELVIDDAIKNTLKRNIYTMFTTLITIVLLAILGVSAIREFVLPITFGIAAGVYSSLFIAGSIWIDLNKLGDKIKESRTKRKPKVKKQPKKA